MSRYNIILFEDKNNALPSRKTIEIEENESIQEFLDKVYPNSEIITITKITE